MVNRLVIALGLPLAAIIFALLIIFIISRILIAFGWHSLIVGTNIPITPFVALLIAFAVLIVCTIVAGRYET
jgi:hypothetical protein